MKTINEGELKKIITYIITACRSITLILLILMFGNTSFGIFGEYKLLDIQFYVLLFCVLPNTLLYLIFTAKYVFVYKRYFAPGNEISKGYFRLSYLPLVVLHVTEWLLIIFNQYFFDASPGIGALEWLVITIECVLAAYAGFYLSDMFKNYIEPTDIKLSTKKGQPE